MQSPISAHLALLLQQADAGATYSPRIGVPCPSCGKRTAIVRTLPWDGHTRIRYHRCDHPGCLLCAAKKTIKSIETDDQ